MTFQHDKKKFTAIGLMSGTSLDGIDAAIIRTNGVEVWRTGHSLTLLYDSDFRDRLKKIIISSNKISDDITTIETELTVLHNEAVQAILKQSGMHYKEIDIIGFHGHTIEHNPEKGITWQIGDGKLLAEFTGINVVNDFRSADVKAGGQGAPLAPLYHRAVVENEQKPVAILNIGGVSNVTYVGVDKLLSFDTGAGNALLDDWIFQHTGNYFDKDGLISSKGVVHHGILETLLSDEYFCILPPKSLDRDYFLLEQLVGLSLEDGAATLAAFTAESVVKGSAFFPQSPVNWYVTGGGRSNPSIMKELSARLKGKVQKIEAIGYDGDALEAEIFAYLAVRSILKLPISLPETTGVTMSSVTGGVFCRV